MDTVTINPPSKSGRSALFFNPAEGRLRGGWRLLIQGLLFLGGGILVQMVIGVVAGIFLVASGANVQDPQVLAAIMENPVMRLVLTLANLVVILLVCAFAARRLDKRPFRDYGFHFNRRWWADLGFGLFLGAFLMLVVFLVERSAGWIRVTPSAINADFMLLILINLLVYICVGISEELFSRGYQVRNLSEALNFRRQPRLAVLIAYLGTSIFFGLLHAGNPNATALSTVLLMLGGLLLGLGYVLTGELALPIGLHITWNFFQGVVFGFPVSGMGHAASFFVIEQGGPAQWTGGAFGPEAGIMGLVAIALGALLIFAWVRVTHGKATLNEELATYSSNPSSLVKNA